MPSGQEMHRQPADEVRRNFNSSRDEAVDIGVSMETRGIQRQAKITHTQSKPGRTELLLMAVVVVIVVVDLVIKYASFSFVAKYFYDTLKIKNKNVTSYKHKVNTTRVISYNL